MRLTPFISSAALLLAATFVAAEEASDVIDLTPDNFVSVVNKEPLILVEFFAPWCGHCKALAPHYEEAATALKEKSIPLAKVDCVDQADLCQQHGVQGYPTLKVFRNGEPSDYTGPRKADGIISYMTKQSLPAVAQVTADNHTDFKQADKIVLIAYLESPTEAPGPAFSEAANKHRDDYLFGYSSDEDVIKEAGVTPPAIVLYRKFDEPRVDLPTDASKAGVPEIVAFIKGHAIPLIDEVGADNYQVYAASALPLAYLFLDPSDPQRDAHIAAIKPIAKKFKGAVNFVWIDAVKYGDHAKALNLVEPKWPSFVVQDLAKQHKYPLDQDTEVTPEAVEVLVDQFVAGKLQPHLKSEPIPESQDEPVITIVGKTFEEIVFDDSKDVFIEFYAPWCGHCKRLKPTWDSLGERYEAVKDKIIITKLDATENDLPTSVPFRVSGFPTLKFKKAGSRDFIDYEGDRSLESLIEFVEQNAENDLTPPAKTEDGGAQSPLAADEPAATQEPEHDEL